MSKTDEQEPQVPPHQGGEMSEVEIDQNLMQSFPASDPPSWTLGIGPNRKAHKELEVENTSEDELPGQSALE